MTPYPGNPDERMVPRAPKSDESGRVPKPDERLKALVSEDAKREVGDFLAGYPEPDASARAICSCCGYIPGTPSWSSRGRCGARVQRAPRGCAPRTSASAHAIRTAYGRL